MDRSILAWTLILLVAFPWPALAVDELRASGDAYYIDQDDDDARDTNRTEPSIDTGWIQVPADYATPQLALDSEECKQGTSTLMLGCKIRLAPGTYAERLEISHPTDTAQQQASIIIEGAGGAGHVSSGGVSLCATTLTGDGSAGHSIISANDIIGLEIRHLCLDMDTAAANDPLYGISIGGALADSVNRLVNIHDIAIFDQGAVGGAGIKYGNSSASVGQNSDTAGNSLRDVLMIGVRTCVVVDGKQVVDNVIENLICSGPTAAIGAVSVGSIGGEVEVRNSYYSSGAASQIGFNVRNEAIGIREFSVNTMEAKHDGVIGINYDATGSTGAYRAHNLHGNRFQYQAGGTNGTAIVWNRAGTLNYYGNDHEHDSTGNPSTLFFGNPSATKASDINYWGNDTQWDGAQSDIEVERDASAGGALRIVALDDGEMYTCSYAGTTASGAMQPGTGGCVAYQPLDADLTDLADGSLTGSKVGTGIAAGNITTGTVPDAQVNGAAESDEITGLTSSQIADGTLTAADLAAGSLTAADAAADLATQAELDALTLPTSGQTGDRLVKTNGNAGDLQQTGISVDSSNNMSGVTSIALPSGSTGTIIVREVGSSDLFECGVSSNAWTCGTDSDGINDGGVGND